MSTRDTKALRWWGKVATVRWAEGAREYGEATMGVVREKNGSMIAWSGGVQTSAAPPDTAQYCPLSNSPI
jgi:hypothetical protein